MEEFQIGFDACATHGRSELGSNLPLRQMALSIRVSKTSTDRRVTNQVFSQQSWGLQYVAGVDNRSKGINPENE
jgi:hypothetical protein